MGQTAFYVNDWAAVSLHPPANDYASFDSWNHYHYELGDGSYVALLGNPVALFPLWVRSLGGDDELLNEERFSTPEARGAHVPEMIAVMDALTRRFATFEELEDALGDPWMLAAHVRSAAELAATDWAAHRGLTAEPVPGVPIPAAPWQSDAASLGNPTFVSSPGDDNRTVLTEAGYSDADIDALMDAGACGDDRAHPLSTEDTMKIDAIVATPLAPTPPRRRHESRSLALTGSWCPRSRTTRSFPLTVAAGATSRVRLASGIAVASPQPDERRGDGIGSAPLRGRSLRLGLGSQIKPHITRRFSMPWSASRGADARVRLAMRAIWNVVGRRRPNCASRATTTRTR